MHISIIAAMSKDNVLGSSKRANRFGLLWDVPEDRRLFKSLTENKSISRYLPKMDEPDKIFKNLIKKPIIPSKKEINENVRSRSAKLRYIVKTKDVFEFDTDVFDKFKSLIEIENFGNKL